MALLVVKETLTCVILSNTSSNISHHDVEYEQQFLYANYYLVILKDFGVIRKVYILNGQPLRNRPDKDKQIRDNPIFSRCFSMQIQAGVLSGLGLSIYNLV